MKVIMPLRHVIADWQLGRIQPDGSNLLTAFMYLYERFFIEARDTG